MGVVPDFGTKVDGREDSGGVHPDVVENVSMEWSDEVKGVVVKVWDVRDVMKEVAFDEFLLRNPKLFTMIVDDRVLVRVVVSNKGAGRGGEEVGEEFR